MSNLTNLLCFEITSRIKLDDPQLLIPYLSDQVGYKCDQDAPSLLYTYRRLVFREGTEDLALMRQKERLYIERLIKQSGLSAEVLTVEVMCESKIPFPTKYLVAYNPVCADLYFKDDENEGE